MKNFNKIRNTVCLLGITFNVILFGLAWILESQDLQLLSLFNMGAFSLGLLADHYSQLNDD